MNIYCDYDEFDLDTLPLFDGSFLSNNKDDVDKIICLTSGINFHVDLQTKHKHFVKIDKSSNLWYNIFKYVFSPTPMGNPDAERERQRNQQELRNSR
jgi:hypothetical protein